MSERGLALDADAAGKNKLNSVVNGLVLDCPFHATAMDVQAQKMCSCSSRLFRKGLLHVFPAGCLQAQPRSHCLGTAGLQLAGLQLFAQ